VLGPRYPVPVLRSPLFDRHLTTTIHVACWLNLGPAPCISAWTKTGSPAVPTFPKPTFATATGCASILHHPHHLLFHRIVDSSINRSDIDSSSAASEHRPTRVGRVLALPAQLASTHRLPPLRITRLFTKPRNASPISISFRRSSPNSAIYFRTIPATIKSWQLPIALELPRPASHSGQPASISLPTHTLDGLAAEK
jgi:hypothetical protein